MKVQSKVTSDHERSLNHTEKFEGKTEKNAYKASIYVDYKEKQAIHGILLSIEKHPKNGKEE